MHQKQMPQATSAASHAPRGCVHGRFQPPHREHLNYILAALERCSPLLIGITQPDAPLLDECASDPHRSQLADNPFTYVERVAAIDAMLRAEGVDAGSYQFSKFPIDRPSELSRVISTQVVCYTTVVNDWNLEKVRRLEGLGYKVIVLWDKRGLAHIEGSAIRQMIRADDSAWESMVHPAVVTYLRSSKLLQRIRNI